MNLDNHLKQLCEKEYAELTNNKQIPDHQVNKQFLQQQNNGRWTREEHIRFVEGLSIYGKNWKKVEDHVATRSGAQIRSHAQKFFNRLEREYSKKQAEFQSLESINHPQRKGSYNFRKRYESIDSQFSNDLLSEEIAEDSVKEEVIKTIQNDEIANLEEKDIKQWMLKFQDHIQDLQTQISQSTKIFQVEKYLEQVQNVQIQKQEEQLSKMKGLYQYISAYDNLQNNDNAGQTSSQPQSQAQSRKDSKEENSKHEDEQVQATFSNNTNQEQNNELLVQDFKLKKQISITKNESFFHYIFSRYGKYFCGDGIASHTKLTNLVDLSKTGDKNNQLPIPDNDNEGEFIQKKRKGSFMLHQNTEDDLNNNEQKLENFRKLKKQSNFKNEKNMLEPTIQVLNQINQNQLNQNPIISTLTDQCQQ